jgi:hypothetical protein
VRFALRVVLGGRVDCALKFRGLRVACTRSLGSCHVGDRRYPAYLLVHRLVSRLSGLAVTRLYVVRN